MNATQPSAIGRAIAGMARAQGFAGLDDLAAALESATGEDYTADELADFPRGGFGDDLDAVLGLSAWERSRLLDLVQEAIGGTVHITPTVLCRADAGRLAAAVVEGPEDGDRALVVFRSEEEAEKYRAATGNHPDAEGWRPVALGLRELSDLLEMHGCSHVAMPEPWTGTGGVDFFAGADFIGMLEEALA